MVHVVPLLGVATQAEPTEGNATVGETVEHATEAQPDNPILPTGPELAWGAASFLLLWALMKFVLLKPIIETMDKRAERIRHDLGNAEQLRAEAAATLTDYETSVTAARAEASRLLDEARAEAEEQRRAVLAEAEAEVTRLRAQANEEVARVKAEALAGMRASVAGIAVQAAELVVGRGLDAAAYRPAVDEYLDRASQN